MLTRASVTDFIHNFVPGKLASTVLVLHGQGGDEHDLLPVARALAPGATFLSPRGKANENGAIRFFAPQKSAFMARIQIRATLSGAQNRFWRVETIGSVCRLAFPT